MMQVEDLESVLSYRNDAVVLRFVETWAVSRSEADELFQETMKWLWLSAKMVEAQARGENALGLAITPSTKLIDEMWHTFILFTRDYCEFCERFFKDYLHHCPTPQDEYERQISEYEASPDEFMAKQETRFEQQFEMVFDLLGEDTVVKWYDDYLSKYSDKNMQKLWRWSFSPYDTRVRESVRLVPEDGPAQGELTQRG